MKKEFDFHFELGGDDYFGSASVFVNDQESIIDFSIILNYQYFGTMEYKDKEWRLKGGGGNPELIKMVAECLSKELQNI